MDYLMLKTIHVGCVAITFVLFVGRGALMLVDSPLIRTRFLRVAPHVNDTLLLCSAAWMAALSGQYPFVQAWLTAKLLALIVYICLGMLALSSGRSARLRIAVFVAALMVFAYIVSVALTRSALSFAIG
ncbi:MAG: regulator SirB [Betaproteobacteria bacterium RIFCSPLOWO2_12_FULL_63_13]|nr:MAG: regulator SirB [Betaproteobacteria bacterium RIFCSPLOWO2_12_FULL_63_13]